MKCFTRIVIVVLLMAHGFFGEKANAKLIALVEPSSYGVNYVRVAVEKGHDFVAIVGDKGNSSVYGYRDKTLDIIVADIRDHNSMIKAIEESGYDFDAIISATNYPLHEVAKVAEYFGLFHRGIDAIFRARRKDLARDIYSENGVGNPKYFYTESAAEALEKASVIGYPLIVKPVDRCASIGVMKVSNHLELLSAFKGIQAESKMGFGFKSLPVVLVEECVDGPHFCVELFLYDGMEIFSSITSTRICEPPYCVEIMQSTPPPHFLWAQDLLVEEAVHAAKSLGFKFGALNIEIILTRDGPVIIEINGRMDGANVSTDLIPLSYGVDLFSYSIDMYLGVKPKVEKSFRQSSAVGYIQAPKKGVFSGVSGIEQMLRMEGVVSYEIYKKSGEQIQPLTSGFDRIGNVICIGIEDRHAEEILCKALNCLQVNYMECSE